MKLFTYLVIFLFALIHSESFASLSSRIVNGMASAAGQFPYQVMVIGVRTNGQSLCGGSLISDEWVLTAGHCVVSVSQFQIHLGAQNFYQYYEPGRVVYSTNQAIVHERYIPSLAANDIALIRLPEKVTFTDRIQPVAIATSDFQLDGETVIATGWGLKSTHASQPASDLQYAELRIVSNAECTKSFDSMIIRPSTLCAQGTNYQSTCSGDSGGPLVLKKNRTLVGVTSFGIAVGCDIGYPGGFSRVPYYSDWIAAKTGIKIRK